MIINIRIRLFMPVTGINYLSKCKLIFSIISYEDLRLHFLLFTQIDHQKDIFE
jgi:hypothetical protein